MKGLAQVKREPYALVTDVFGEARLKPWATHVIRIVGKYELLARFRA
jgi:hypothetical protein